MRWVAAIVCIASHLVGCGPDEPRRALDPSRVIRRSINLPGPVNQLVSYIESARPSGLRVIYVHGTPGDAISWLNYVVDPVPGTHSMALDRPGFAMSEPDGAVTSLAAQAAAVVALFPDNGEQVVLVGHSLGGAIVARVAAEHPQRVLSLVLLASSLDPAQERIHPLQRLGQIQPIKSVVPRMLRNANDELMELEHELNLLEPMLANIQAPTIIVHGTKDDLVPFANVLYVQGKLTGAQCVKTRVLEGTNHFLPWNSEPAVREAIAWATQQVYGAF